MPFDVRWTPESEEALAEICLRAADRSAVTRAEHAIAKFFTTSPQAGKHLSEGLYSIRVAPLVVYYEVQAGDQIVNVTQVAAG